MIYIHTNTSIWYRYILPRRITKKHVYRWLWWVWTPYIVKRNGEYIQKWR